LYYKNINTYVGTSVIAPKNNGKIVGGSNSAILLPEKLTIEQNRILNFAYKTAKEDGHKHPEILQAILLQETRAGDMKSFKVAGQEFGLKTNERYYGIAQIKLDAAKDVLKTYPDIKNKYNFHTDTDEEIIAHLIMNDEFNIEVASKYLLIISRYNKDSNFIIGAYNKGINSAKQLGENIVNLEYVKKVKQYMSKL
jgi:predicted nucleic-acid-binding protein